MRRPSVLHVVEHWGRPSETFVSDVVRSCTATRAVVAAQQSQQPLPPGGYDLSWCSDGVSEGAGLFGHLPAPVRQVHLALAAIAVRERAAVLHSHFGLPAFATWRAARRLGRPFAVSLHGYDVLVAADQDPAIGAALNAAALVVVPSRFLAQKAIQQGAREQRVRVVPSGLDLGGLPFRERRTPDGPPLITFAGRFADKKGVLDVAHAMAAVAQDRPLRARFVGHGPLEPQLRRLLAELGLDAEIVDGRPAGAVRRSLSEADVVVTGSRTTPEGDAETLGLVNLEALACGAQLVTTHHGGTAEVVPDTVAELVPEAGDIAASLADALRRVLDRPEEWAARSRAGRAHVAAHFELGARTADLERLWLEVAAGSRELWVPSVPDARPTVSVVLVTHNRLPLLEQTLDALAAQTLPPQEVLVVDNGSTDGSADLLDHRVAAQDPPGLRVLRRNDNLPVAEGRNLAVAEATSEVIAFTDDDCRPQPTWLEALVSGLRDGVDLVQGRTTADPRQPLERLSRTQWTPAEFGLYETCNIAYRRTAFERVGGFDLAFADEVAAVLGPKWGHYPFGEDTDLGWRAKRAGATSAFAVHAVVEHEVFAPDPALLVRRAALAAAFPVLVRRVPELRTSFLTGGFVLGKTRAQWWLAAGGTTAALLRRDLRPLAVALPYLDRLLGLRTLHRPGGRRGRLKQALVLARHDAVQTAALVRGSVRSGEVVL